MSELEIWFAQTVHNLENNNFIIIFPLKLSSDGEWGRGLGAEKDTALPLLALSHLSSHLNQQNYFFHIQKDSRIQPRTGKNFIFLFTVNPTVISMCSAFIDCCKERTDRHQSG